LTHRWHWAEFMPVVYASFTRGILLSKKARLGRAGCYFLHSCLAERAVMEDSSSFSVNGTSFESKTKQEP
jgi:hypothetical protein